MPALKELEKRVDDADVGAGVEFHTTGFSEDWGTPRGGEGPVHVAARFK